jgi:hypothetical protein
MKRRIQPRDRLISALAGSLLVALACADDSIGPGLNVCRGGVGLNVDPTPTPDFTWTPVCGVQLLLVEELSVPPGQAVRWRIFGDALLPPIRYGILPNGGIEAQPAQPLVVGHTYRVTVHRDEGGSTIESGMVTFIATIIGTP